MARKRRVRLLGSRPVNYQPQDWSFVVDEFGNKVYKDHRLNILVANLKTAYDLVEDLRVQSQIDLLQIQTNLNTHTTHDPSVGIIGWIASKCVEVIALAFPAGNAAAIISGLVCRLISGGIQRATSNTQTDAYNRIQDSVNDIRGAMDVLFTELQHQITQWQADPRKYWLEPYDYPKELDGVYKGPITLSQLADSDTYFPRKGQDDDYDMVKNLLFRQTRRVVTAQLLPVNYGIHWSKGMDPTGKGYVSNKRWFWQVAWYETSSSSKWNEWRRHPDFPAIPSSLSDSIGGWWEDIDYYEDYRGGRQYFQPFDRQGDHDKSAPGHIWYWWTRRDKHRWMYWGGRHVPCENAHDQGPGDDRKIDGNGNIIQGTPFLDLVDDIMTTDNYGTGYSKDISLMYYQLKDPRTKEIYTNSRRVEHMTCVDYCNDWYYEVNTWRWNWAYRGIGLKFAQLVTLQGDPAPDSLGRWLFRDDGHGHVTNPHGIADRLDVFFNWNLPKV